MTIPDSCVTLMDGLRFSSHCLSFPASSSGGWKMSSSSLFSHFGLSQQPTGPLGRLQKWKRKRTRQTESNRNPEESSNFPSGILVVRQIYYWSFHDDRILERFLGKPRTSLKPLWHQIPLVESFHVRQGISPRRGYCQQRENGQCSGTPSWHNHRFRSINQNWVLGLHSA